MDIFRQLGNSWHVRLLRRVARFLQRPRTARDGDGTQARSAVGPRLVDVNRVLVTAAALFAPLMGDQIQLGLRVSPGRALVAADATDVENVLLALALHARDEMPRGGMLFIESTIIFEPQRDGGDASRPRVRIAVSDTGVGAEGIDGPAAGARSESCGTADRNYAITIGPGLAVAAGGVRRMGGTLDVNHELFVGTTVIVTLPLAVAETPA